MNSKENKFMNINIKATNTTLTDAIKATIHDKLQVLEPHMKSEDKIYFEIAEDTHHKSGMFSRVEVRISPAGHYAEANGNDFYEAIDLVVPKIRDQIIKKKDKRISLRRRLGAFFKRNR